MGILGEIFGPGRKEIWGLLSEQIGAEFVDGGFFSGPDRIVARYGEWTVTLDTYDVYDGTTSTSYTRMRAPYVNADGFRFSIYRSGIFSELGEFLGFRDIEIGNEDFDRDFVIKSPNEDKVRELLAEPRIRELIDRQPRFHMEVKDDEGWFRTSFPEGVDELYFQVAGVLKDIEALKDLFELFSEVLNRLCVIGSAYRTDPGVEL